jgi:hypothetical protein
LNHEWHATIGNMSGFRSAAGRLLFLSGFVIARFHGK